LNTVLIRIAIDLKIFKLMVEKERPLTLKELADMTGADYALLQRIKRSPAAVKVLEEVDVETYLPNIIATTFAGEKGAVNSKCLYGSLSLQLQPCTVYRLCRGYLLTPKTCRPAVLTAWNTDGTNYPSSLQKPNFKPLQLQSTALSTKV